MRSSERRAKAIGFHNQAAAVIGEDKQQAYRFLCSAVVLDPTCAAAMYWLGCACADMKMWAASIAAFRRCLALPFGAEKGDKDTDLHAKASVNLGHRLISLGRVEEAIEVTREAIAYLEQHPEADQDGRAFAWTNMSLALSVQGKDAEALEYAQKAYDMSNAPIIETGLAFAKLYAGDFAQGLAHFEARFAYKQETMGHFLRFPYPRWDGSELL